MKIGKKGSIGFTIGGILAVISSLFPTSNHIISGQVKLIGGIALIIFGLTRLLFNYESKEERKKNQRTALLIVSMLIIGVVAYFVQDAEPKERMFAKTYGTFEVILNDQRCSGKAILEGDNVTFQIKKIPNVVTIGGFKLYNGNIEIETKSIDMVCALMSDMRVIRCSIGLDLPRDNFEMFLDKGSYTISYRLKYPLENVKISDISFTVLTDREEQNVRIVDEK